MTTHEWRERDEENQLIFYRAKLHAGRWTFHSRPKSEEDWINHEVPPLDLLQSFRGVLWNKIQRRRAPEKQIDVIDEMLEKIRGDQLEEEE